MGLSFDDLRHWDATPLDTAVDAIRVGKDQLLELDDELQSAFGPIRWHGEAADAARHRLGVLKDRAEHIVAEAGTVQREFVDASDRIRALSRRVVQLDSRARQGQFRVEAGGHIVDTASVLSAVSSNLDEDDQAETGRRRGLFAADLAREAQAIMKEAVGIDAELEDTLARAEAGEIYDGNATTLAAADWTAWRGGYRIGPPSRPDISHGGDDFEYDSQEPTVDDIWSMAKWMATLDGAQRIGHLPDATAMYEHYWSNTGEPKEIDYEKAYREDLGIRLVVRSEISTAAQAASEFARHHGAGEFQMTGPAWESEKIKYAQTENWQKTLGTYRIWSHANVHVEQNTVTMEITVHAEDRYNFNRWGNDVATDVPDDENGRFAEIGWAKPFDVHGSLTRTITWKLGSPPPGDT